MRDKWIEGVDFDGTHCSLCGIPLHAAEAYGQFPCPNCKKTEHLYMKELHIFFRRVQLLTHKSSTAIVKKWIQVQEWIHELEQEKGLEHDNN